MNKIMSKKLVWLIVIIVVVVAVLVVVLGDGAITSPALEETVVSPPTSGEEAAADNTVFYTDDGFSPKVLEIGVGEQVTWVNKSSGDMWPASAIHPTHMVYDGTSLEEHCAEGAGPTFDACEPLGELLEWSFVFDKPGEWKYHDHLQPTHTGTVIVK